MMIPKIAIVYEKMPEVTIIKRLSPRRSPFDYQLRFRAPLEDR
tara:strand:- start:3978 stop:4106 length:129 start_codon:yes stop_codon:yes gene_type:complete